ncbi:MAG: class I adenylate-forming enzyme family protein [Acidobacteriota bacterium]
MNAIDPSLPLLDAFDRHVRDRPQALAVLDEASGASLTRAQLDRGADALRRRLATLRPTTRAGGDGAAPIGLMLTNRPAFLVATLAVLRTPDAALVLFDATAAGSPMTIAADCARWGVTRMIVDAQQTAAWSSTGAPMSAIAPLDDGLACAQLPRATDAPDLPASLALIKRSSGTTGRPEGAGYDLEALRSGIDQIARGMAIGGDDRVLLGVPLSHSYGFDSGALSLFALGTPLILTRGRHPGGIVRSLARHGATVLPTVPPIARALSVVAWPDALPLRRAICAGGALAPAVASAFCAASGRPLHNFYGSTQTGGITFERAPEMGEAAGTVGVPLPGVDVALDDDGAVRVRSAANRRLVLRDDGSVDAQPSPAVVTGDLAAWTPSGRLRLTGRRTDVLKIAGRSVPIPAVEAALRALGGVRDAAVVGLPDPARGERAVAFVVADRWPLPRAPQAVRRPDLHRLERLPYTDRGKLDRAALRHLARQHAARVTAAHAADRVMS